MLQNAAGSRRPPPVFRWLVVSFLIKLPLVALADTSVVKTPALVQNNEARNVFEFVRQEMRKQQIPGAQLAVVRGGKLVVLSAFGLANIEHEVPATNETIFAINSCTKAFTGVALMQLVEEGKLELDAPVSRYLEKLPQAWRGVTIRQMATNTSGLPEYFLGTRLLVEDDFPASWAKVQTLPMVFKPGERVQYNQTNWLLLQWIIERLSGMRFAQFVKERQFDVVGMPRTARAGWGDDFTVQPRKARVYANIRNVHKTGDWGDFPGGQDFIVDTHQLRNHAAGVAFPREQNSGTGIESTAEELARWLIAVQDGTLLNKERVKEMWKPAVLSDGSIGMWAIGWPSYERSEHPLVMPSGGGRSAFAIYTKDDVAIVLLTNLLGAWPERIIDEIAAYFVDDPEMHRDRGFGLSNPLKILHAQLVTRGFATDDIEAAIREAQIADPTFGSADELKSYGLHLFWTAKYEEALRVFEVNAQLHPDSVVALQTLASAYELNGNELAADRLHLAAQQLKGRSRKRGQ